ncbi:rod shape-determining protein [Anaplasma phagocytophilum]|uniref:rod shape-determining protein n=1 Tax=Anaplasma phagocytophilum TaxID=948 RepID=UPI001F1F7C1B|nr:rod shape-determining protein [Anaplasma phagocytophilum]
MSIILLGRIVYSRSLRSGGDLMDEAIIAYTRKNHNLLIGDATAEKVKNNISAARIPEERSGDSTVVKGRDLTTGVPREITLTEKEVAESLTELVDTIIAAIKLALECSPPEISADIVDQGIALTGGASMLKNL